METIVCIGCGQSKPIADFIRIQKDTRTGKPYQFQRKKCIACISRRQKDRLVERFGYDGFIKYRKLEHFRRRCRQVYHIHHDHAFQMLKNQNNQCLICQHPIEFFAPQYENEACVDHDHLTGRVRGILCHWCNTGIGYFQDCPDKLQKCQDYLRAQSVKSVTVAATRVAGVCP